MASFANLEILGKRGIKVILAFTLDLLESNFDSKIYRLSKYKNEKIYNGTYYFFIPVTFPANCEKGQFFDLSQFLIVLLSFFFNFVLDMLVFNVLIIFTLHQTMLVASFAQLVVNALKESFQTQKVFKKIL